VRGDVETDPDPAARTLARIYLALCILALAAMLIHSIPAHHRQRMALRLLRSSRLATSRLARRAGVASMGRELATGEQLYGLPYLLARWAERLAAAYNRQAMT
jgi:hypothetical protein